MGVYGIDSGGGSVDFCRRDFTDETSIHNYRFDDEWLGAWGHGASQAAGYLDQFLSGPSVL